jgi:oligopeptidase B
MLDETIPLTTNEWSQWGDPRERTAYRYLLSYSPYDQLARKPYPAMFVTTGLWDSQVGYYEPAKYVARLRALKTNDTPLLFHTELEAGHGGRSGRFDALVGLARQFVFCLELAGIRE